MITHTETVTIYLFILEIPLFHVLNARITFGNIFGLDQEIPHVHRIQETNRTTCIVDDVCFEVPSGYIKLGKFPIFYIYKTKFLSKISNNNCSRQIKFSKY